ncbi:MATE family efflux transporter [Lacrimispora sp. NSJ-141]|uniref:Probable multidrug resistance protein NorM n=1 Tax=Lientehia hominis TaxID=2897778 RepID=A0AAP2W7J8_9FIRM|nr:MATE family efflux transporter [Lientehia hominis]MCD2491125.1 MATE family efflux transporter [Lientehia hominis]
MTEEKIQKTQPQENKMGVMPVNKLLISMSLPIMISMLVQAMYNIVDSVFVGRLSEAALTAVSMAFPIQSLMIAFGTGTAVGINAYLSRNLGERNFAQADAAAINGIFLAFLSYIAFAVFGLFGSRFFFASQIQDEVIVRYGTDYLTICTMVSIGLFMQMTLERILQSTGKTIYTMITQGTGAIINIIFDPIMIFGLFGFPRMEVAGAAAATVLGQCVAAVMALIFNLKKNDELHFRFRKFRPSGYIIRQIYKVGIPSIIMQAVVSLMTLLMNGILLMFSSTAVSVFGVYFKLQSFVFMPVFGLNNGMIPIVAYNFGARKKKRIIDTIKLSVVIAVGIMAVGFAVFQIFPEALIRMFNNSPDMISMGVPALRRISLCFVFAGAAIVISSVFQALGNGFYSLLISLIRQIFVIVPVAYLFAVSIGLDAVWFAFPIAEIVSAALCVVLLIRTYRKQLKNIPDSAPESV